MTVLPQKKSGRPHSKRLFPAFPFTQPQLDLIVDSLRKHGGIVLPTLGILVLRRTNDRRLKHNFSGKVITIKGRKKLHIINTEKLETL